jgi:hypothetical protein
MYRHGSVEVRNLEMELRIDVCCGGPRLKLRDDGFVVVLVSAQPR